jgi:prepilin-type N-terminal cleavage/methylation domain-containing protein
MWRKLFARLMPVAVGCVLSVLMMADATAADDLADGTDLRDALAQTVIERNSVTQRNDLLENQRWLLIGYAVLMTLAFGWLMRSRLLQGQGNTADSNREVTVLIPTHANAVITVRNPETQREEVTARVATRRLFNQTTSSTAAPTPYPTTTRAKPIPKTKQPNPPAKTPATSVLTRKVILPPAATPVPEPTPEPATSEYTPSEIAKPATQTDTPSRSVIVDEFADLDDLADLANAPVEDSPHTRLVRSRTLNNNPSTRPGNSRSGLSMIEIMIALAILATVLASVSAGIFTLSHSKQAMNEDLAVSDVLRLWSERLMGAEWDWLGRDRVDDTARGAWSWQRPEIGTAALLPGDYSPLTETSATSTDNLTTLLLGGSPSGLRELRLYLEYYRPEILDAGLMTQPSAVGDQWSHLRATFRLTPPIDLRVQQQAVVIRVLARWRTPGGTDRQRELLFARRK